MHYTEDQIQEIDRFNPAFARILRMEHSDTTDGQKPDTPKPVVDVVEVVSNGDSKKVEAPTSEPLPVVEDSSPNQLAEKPKPDASVSPEVEVKDVEWFKKEAERLRKRLSDAQSSLTPKLQENAELKKDVGRLEEEIASLRSELKNAIQQRLAPVVDDEPDDLEIEESFPVINRKMASENAKLRKEIQDLKAEVTSKLKPIEEITTTSKQRIERDERVAKEAAHFSQVKAIHTDAADFFEPTKLGEPFYAWVQSKPQYVQAVYSDPTAFPPADMADLIGSFKREVMSLQKQTPAPGDLSSRVTPASLKSAPQKSPDLLSDYEMANINKLLARAGAQGRHAIEELNQRYELTLQSKE